MGHDQSRFLRGDMIADQGSRSGSQGDPDQNIGTDGDDRSHDLEFLARRRNAIDICPRIPLRRPGPTFGQDILATLLLMSHAYRITAMCAWQACLFWSSAFTTA